MSNELDKHISEQLHRYESAVDAEAIWAAVKPPRKRRPWFWLLFLLGGIGVAGGAWWLLTTGEQEEATSTIAIVSDNQEEQTQLQQDSETYIEQHDEITAAYDSNVSVKKAATSNGNQAGSFQGEGHTVDGPSQIASGNNSGSQVMQAPTRNTTTNLLTLQAAPGDTEDSDPVITQVDKEQQTAVGAEEGISENSDIIEEEETLAITTVGSAEAETMEVNAVEPIETSLVKREALPLDYRLDTRGGLLATAVPSLDRDPILEKSSRYHKRGASPWSVQVDAAYLLVDRELTAPDSLCGWKLNREATESVLEATSVDLTASYAVGKNWQIRAGLGYTQINSEFAITTTSVETDTVEGVTIIIINPDNTVDSIYGTIPAYETFERQRIIYNSFRQWELPVLVNYEAGFGRMRVIAEAGARIRFRRTWEGQVLNASEEVVPLEDQQWYRDGLGISLQAGLQLGYELNPQLQVRLGGTFRYDPKDFSAKEQSFSERYQLRGLQLGLRYQLR